MVKKAIQEKKYVKAIDLLTKAQTYPENLGEGKLTGAQENEIFFWIGCACEGLGDLAKAKEFWEKAATGLDEPSAAIFYNDQQPDTIFYPGLALIKLGKKAESKARFETLINFGKLHLEEEFKPDLAGTNFRSGKVVGKEIVQLQKIFDSFFRNRSRSARACSSFVAA